MLLSELRRLAAVVDPGSPGAALKDLTVVVTHVKPTVEDGSDVAATIKRQLEHHNDLGCRFVLAEQGRRLTL